MHDLQNCRETSATTMTENHTILEKMMKPSERDKKKCTKHKIETKMADLTKRTAPSPDCASATTLPAA